MTNKAMMIYDRKKKSTVVGLLFWFFLGGFSAHRFYAGLARSAFVQLGLGIVSWLVFSVQFLAGLEEVLVDFEGGLVVFAVPGLLAWALWVFMDAFLVSAWIGAHNRTLMARLS